LARISFKFDVAFIRRLYWCSRAASLIDFTLAPLERLTLGIPVVTDTTIREVYDFLIFTWLVTTGLAFRDWFFTVRTWTILFVIYILGRHGILALLLVVLLGELFHHGGKKWRIPLFEFLWF